MTLRVGILEPHCELQELMDSVCIGYHNGCATLDHPPHREGREARRIGWKLFPVVPDDGGTVHPLGVVEHLKARGRVQNLLVRDDSHVDRSVDRLNPEVGIGGVPARTSEDGRPPVSAEGNGNRL